MLKMKNNSQAGVAGNIKYSSATTNESSLMDRLARNDKKHQFHKNLIMHIRRALNVSHGDYMPVVIVYHHFQATAPSLLTSSHDDDDGDDEDTIRFV